MHYDMNEHPAMTSTAWILGTAFSASLLVLGGCKVGIFDNENHYWQPDSAQVEQIDPVGDGNAHFPESSNPHQITRAIIR